MARRILESGRDKVEAMAAALLEFETIDSDQIDDVMNGRPVRPPKPTQGSTPSSSPPPSTGAAGSAEPSTNPV